MRRLLYLFVLSALTFSFIACGNKDKSNENENTLTDQILDSDSRYDKLMLRTKEDSTKIIELATQYLDLLQQNRIDEALSMLYEVDDSAKVTPLSDSFKTNLKKQLKSFPVLSYQIDYFKIFEALNTELRYTYEFVDKPEGSPLPNTMKGVLSPCRIDGKWYLTISPDLVDTERNNIENSKYN